jgi:hypothetical protein
LCCTRNKHRESRSMRKHSRGRQTCQPLIAITFCIAFLSGQNLPVPLNCDYESSGNDPTERVEKVLKAASVLYRPALHFDRFQFMNSVRIGQTLKARRAKIITTATRMPI